jgi:glycosyltransferase involved in cell wall biosynthesis
MSNRSGPLVSVLTPVYNGAKFLAKCVDSVLAQTHQNWEYIIVNNCSTDNTLEIASRYAERDDRIKVQSNRQFVGVIDNHNIAFRSMSQESRYCKVVAADDYLFPECIERLVEACEREPRVGIVGSYAMHDVGFRRVGLPLERSFFEGREVCRLYLLGAIGCFGTPSTVLYRSDLVRSREPFFPGALPNGDLAACLACLENADFAFVHQILCFERIHNESLSAELGGSLSFQIDNLQLLAEYGPKYLGGQEVDSRKQELLREVYDSLADGAVRLKRSPCWKFQRARLASLGFPSNDVAMAGAICRRVTDLLLNPKQTAERIIRRIRRRALLHQPKHGHALSQVAAEDVVDGIERLPITSLPRPVIAGRTRSGFGNE